VLLSKARWRGLPTPLRFLLQCRVLIGEPLVKGRQVTGFTNSKKKPWAG